MIRHHSYSTANDEVTASKVGCYAVNENKNFGYGTGKELGVPLQQAQPTLSAWLRGNFRSSPYGDAGGPR